MCNRVHSVIYTRIVSVKGRQQAIHTVVGREFSHLHQRRDETHPAFVERSWNEIS